jgi:hypothetical protein
VNQSSTFSQSHHEQGWKAHVIGVGAAQKQLRGYVKQSSLPDGASVGQSAETVGQLSFMELGRQLA